MKLRVLFLSIILSFGLFFSSYSVQQANAINVTDTLAKMIEAFKVSTDAVVAESSEIDINNTTSEIDTTTAVWALGNLVDSKEDVGGAISMIFENSPASGEIYVADLLHNMKVGPAQPAYAQVGGLGFAALEPVLYAWKQFRNIAYLFFIIITLIIGFMIMMRQKIGSQAAVTAQQAIPQIVIALITVTFSYAIAGFMIDLMYVFMFLLVGLFPDQTGENPIAKNLFSIGLELFSGGIGTAFTAVNAFTQEALGINEQAEQMVGFITGLTFALIIAIAYIFAMIQLFFELLKTYIAIIVSIILSPLLLMMGALPGRSDVFGNWIRSIAGNLIAYPVVLLLIILHKLMTTGPAVQGGFLPPFLLGRGAGSGITALMGLAVMLIAKDLVVQAKKSVNPKGSGIFEQFGAALSSAVSKGWKGGELVPGVGLTDTNKMPGIKHIGSGKRIASHGAVLGGGLIGAPLGAARNVFDRRVLRSPTKEGAKMGALRGAVSGARRVGQATGNTLINDESAKKAKEFAQRRGGGGSH
jgi:hypothetical protein